MLRFSFLCLMFYLIFYELKAQSCYYEWFSNPICTGQTVTLTVHDPGTSCTSVSQFPSNLRDSLKFYYPFCTNSYDYGAYCGNNLSTNGVALTWDRYSCPSCAYDFFGIASYMNAPDICLMSGNSPRTIALWVYNRGSISSGADSVASSLLTYGKKNSNEYFQILHASSTSPGSFNVNFGSTTIYSTSKVLFNTWQFLAFTLDASSNYSLYINANLAGTGSVSINTTPLAGFYLGRAPVSYTPSNCLNGKLDDIVIYNRALSSTEISQLYTLAGSVTSYTWSTGVNTKTIVVSPTVTTTYTTSAANGTNSCTGNITVSVTPCTGINEFTNSSLIQLYPNPSSSNLEIQSEKNFDKESRIIITNYLGQTILEIPFLKDINVSSLPSGLYFLKIISPNTGIQRTKFIKE